MLNNKYKKGQVSLFVVIGAIIVIVGIFLFFNNKLDIFSSHDSKMKNQISEIVNECIDDSARRGVELLAYQGGRIYIPDYISRDFRKYIDLGLKIPTWDTSNGDIPTILSMQGELERFVQDNLISCVNANFLQMGDYFDINISDDLNVAVEIKPENVAVSVNYPIMFNEKNSDEKLSVDDFYVNLESVRLGDMFELAMQIYNLEEREYFLEELVMDQIYSATDYSDSRYSMPSEGMEISCIPRIWTKSRLKETLANMNNNNFKYLQFSDTFSKDKTSFLNLDEDLQSYFRAHYFFVLPNAKPSFRGFDVSAFMPSKQITGDDGYLQRYPYRQFDVIPDNGELVKSQSMEIDGGINIPVPCIQLYHHVYSLDYDLIMKIVDFNDDEGNGFFFQFPLRVQIKENNPKSTPSNPIISEGALATNDVYCQNDSKIYPLSIYVQDTVTNNYLSDVNISYQCLNLKCDIGQTKFPTFRGVVRTGASPILEEDFPYCYGGKVIAEKEGYHKAEIRVNTPLDENTVAPDIFLTPVKNFYLDIASFLIVDKNTFQSKRIYNEEQDGLVFVSIKNKGKNFESFGMWPNDGEFLNSIKLLDDSEATYNLSVMYVNADDDLTGMLTIDDWQPDIHAGNLITFTVPSVSSGIDETNYIQFFDDMSDLINNPSPLSAVRYGVTIS